MSLALNHSSLHHTIIKHIIDNGYGPSIADLASIFNTTEDPIRVTLKNLQDCHGVILHPHNSEVWVIHPFSLGPTLFLLNKGKQEWWCNCAWCALGAASLLGGDVTITTTLGANSEQVRIRIHNGQLLDTDYYIHFPIPMTHVWDNVIYTCSTMLMFRSEHEVDDWVVRHNIAKGDIRPIAQVWEFAKIWYSKHLDNNWQKWTGDEAAALFKRFGLDGPTWEIPVSGERF